MNNPLGLKIIPSLYQNHDLNKFYDTHDFDWSNFIFGGKHDKLGTLKDYKCKKCGVKLYHQFSGNYCVHYVYGHLTCNEILIEEIME